MLQSTLTMVMRRHPTTMTTLVQMTLTRASCTARSAVPRPRGHGCETTVHGVKYPNANVYHQGEIRSFTSNGYAGGLNFYASRNIAGRKAAIYTGTGAGGAQSGWYPEILNISP